MAQRKDQRRVRGTKRAPAAPALDSPAADGGTPTAGADSAGGPAASTPAAPLPRDQPRWLAKDEAEAPVRPALTRRRIVLAGLQLVEEHGLDALTMRRVGGALQVTPMSLYNHVSDKAELVDLMMDYIIGDVVEAAVHDAGDWEARLRSLTYRNFEMWQQHPGFVKVYTEGVTMGPNGVANVELAVSLLREAGFSEADAAAAFLMLYRWNISSLLIAPARPVGRTDRESRARANSAEDRMKLYFSAVPAEEIPSVRATAKYMTGHGIDFGLDVIIKGFKTVLAEQAQQAQQAQHCACTPATPAKEQGGPAGAEADLAGLEAGLAAARPGPSQQQATDR